MIDHFFELVISMLFICAAAHAAFIGNWPYVLYGISAAFLQIAVILMGK